MGSICGTTKCAITSDKSIDESIKNSDKDAIEIPKTVEEKSDKNSQNSDEIPTDKEVIIVYNPIRPLVKQFVPTKIQRRFVVDDCGELPFYEDVVSVPYSINGYIVRLILYSIPEIAKKSKQTKEGVLILRPKLYMRIVTEEKCPDLEKFKKMDIKVKDFEKMLLEFMDS